VRIWTEAEARAYLPRLRELLDMLRPGAPAERVEAVLAELDDNSIVMRQVGLVDFPAFDADGDLYFLCWKSDEDDLEWWHRPEDGFAGRQPLPR
jgi:hypothetical protein